MPDPAQNAQFAEFFNSLLASRGLTGAQAARRLGVAQSQVSRWKRGEGGISMENLQRIHNELGIDMAYLTSLAGLRDSNATIDDSIEAERQLWRARYDDLIEKKVPRWAREAYIAACEALAEAYTQMRPGALSTPDAPSVNKVSGENDEGTTGGDNGSLSHCYRLPTHGYQFDRLSAAPAG